MAVKLGITNYKLQLVLSLTLAAISSAQIAPLKSSHAPVAAASNAAVRTAAPAQPTAAATQAAAPAKPVAHVNGAVLTENDLTRMMYTMFPYARLHNGVPKSMETEVRQGALQMVIFEELLYQEAQRRRVTVPAERVARAEAQFRKQFPTKDVYEQYLRLEVNGSKPAMREKIRRSLLIEQMLKTEVEQKAAITVAAAKAYYDKNPKEFEHPERVAIQTISIIPPADASPAVKAEAKAKIKDIVRLGRAAKTSRDFGLIAEQLSEDDWRTRMGDRGTVDIKTLPPEVVKVLKTMKEGGVSDAIQIGDAWVVVRLNEHTPAGRTPFLKAKAKLESDLRKQKREEIRSALNRKLRQDAKIELL